MDKDKAIKASDIINSINMYREDIDVLINNRDSIKGVVIKLNNTIIFNTLASHNILKNAINDIITLNKKEISILEDELKLL